MPRAKVAAKSRKSTKKIVRASNRASSPQVNTSQTMNTSPSTAGINEKIKNPRVFIPLIILVLLFLAFLLKGLFIAALVNGQPISRLSVISQLEKQSGKDTLNQIVTQVLVQQEASKKNINVSQQDVDGQISKIEAQLKTQGVTLDQALSSRGMTRADLSGQIRLQLELQKLVGPVKVTDAQVTSYITANKDQMPQGLSDDQIKAQATQQVEQQMVQQKEQALVQQLQKDAKISYFVSY